MNIYNGTAHAINIIIGAEFAPKIRKYIGGTVQRSIPLNRMLNAKFETRNDGNIDSDIPLFNKEIIDCEELPEGYDLYIVSAIYAVAYIRLNGKNEKVFTIADPVVESEEKQNVILGCIGIMPAL